MKTSSTLTKEKHPSKTYERRMTRNRHGGLRGPEWRFTWLLIQCNLPALGRRLSAADDRVLWDSRLLAIDDEPVWEYPRFHRTF